MIVSAEYGPDDKQIKVIDENGFEVWVLDDMSSPARQALEEWSKTEGNEIKAYTPPPEAKPA